MSEWIKCICFPEGGSFSPTVIEGIKKKLQKKEEKLEIKKRVCKKDLEAVIRHRACLNVGKRSVKDDKESSVQKKWQGEMIILGL